MANSKISALPSATTPLAGTEVLPVVQGGITEQVSVANLTAGRDVSASGLFVDANSATDAVRITQLGAGNALLVEDSASPDASPLVIEANGRLVKGYTSAIPSLAATNTPDISAVGVSTSNNGFGNFQYTAGTAGSFFSFAKSRSTTPGSFSILSINDDLGYIRFNGDDGTQFVEAARVWAEVDGTPNTNDMPGRLIFSTTASGASSPTEAMRITSAQRVGIGTTAPLTALNVNGTGGELIRISVTPDGATQQEPALGFATGVSNTNPAAKISALEFDASDSRASLLFYTRGTNSDVAPTLRLTIDSAGTVTLASTSGLSIGRTAVTGTPASTDGNVFSGTYTPTLFNTTNVAASTASVLQYSRVGNYVQIAGQVTIDPTAAGAVVLGMSLPVASALTSAAQAGGTFSGVTAEVGYIVADATNDRLTFNYTATSVTNNIFYFTAGYQVL
jgi:hypothetical protein